MSKINVLVVEPMQTPRCIQIDNALEAMQKVVGGSIELYAPFEDEAVIICNEEGKINKLPLNRAIYSKESNEIKEIIAGTFFICLAPLDSDEFDSLPQDLLKKYFKLFEVPEIFSIDLETEKIVVEKIADKKGIHNESHTI